MMYRDFWKAGYKIFPLYGTNKDGTCQCGDIECAAILKHPRIGSWSIIPLFDEDVINNFEEFDQFATGYGVLCSGLLVIDVDARNGGVESFERLVREYPSINESRLEVATGSGGGSKHVYFRLPEPIALIQSHADYPGIDFKSSGYVVGPGSRHASGGSYEADGYPEEITDAPDDLIALLRKPERHRVDYNGTPLDVSHDDIEEMLRYIPNSGLDYEVWVRVGMAVHHATGGTGYDLWDAWSATCPDKHDENRMPNKWHSFGRSANPVTVGTLIHHAQENGWVMPVRMLDGMGDLPEMSMKEPEPVDGLPFDISGIDLTQPPGFTGDLARWIGANSMRPRKHLAVAGALMAIANMGGLRYTDEKGLTTTNLFCFCVAGSGTGKENVFSRVLETMEHAGMPEAFYGDIKSSKEIVENFIEHQAAVYCIDEVADSFDKWEGNGKNTPSYLSDVMSVLMSAYSKANGMLVLKGDRKRELQGSIGKELSKILEREKNNEASPYDMARKPSLERMAEKAKLGVEKPFVSIIGFTTPVKFDKLVTFDNATSGFIGRSLIFNERDTAPRMKEDFAPIPMTEQMSNTILQIAQGGTYDMFAARVEYYENRIPIPSTPEATEMLSKARRWYDDKAEDHKSISGLEPLWMRALELLGKVSLTLAIPEGLRTAEHVRWAFALVRRDIEEKLRLVVGNENEKRDPAKAMMARIMNMCGEAESQGVIVNRLIRTYRKDDIIRQIEIMVERGMLTSEERKHARTSKIYQFYTAVG